MYHNIELFSKKRVVQFVFLKVFCYEVDAFRLCILAYDLI